VAFSVQEASERILAAIHPLGTETVPLRDALGRVLASDARSPIEHPPWDNSSMDGYAVRAADVEKASKSSPVVLPVAETVRAGQRPSAPIAAGTAVRVMTGAPVPDGADTVIRVEDTDGAETRVEIRDARDARRNVRPRGEDLQVGAIAVVGGTVLGPAQLGVLASIGCAVVEVHRRPRVAVLTCGDELVDVDQFDLVRRGDRIVSSNGYTTTAAATVAGAEVIDLGIVPDDPTIYAERLSRALDSDLVITTGGVSVGAFDFTKDVVRSLGADLHLWRVLMRPGAPLGFGTLRAVPWLGLPGNPVSAMVTFEIFARPVIRRLRGERNVFPHPIAVRVREDVAIGAPLTHFMRAVVAWEDGVAWTKLTGPQGSGLLTSMSLANALLVVPPERPLIRAGESATAILLGDRALSSASFAL
jgi:molybdopterin molybdotransferase